MGEAQPRVQCRTFADQPVLVIDNVHPRPGDLLAQARQSTFSKDPGNYYPGVRCPAGDDYRSFVHRILQRHGPPHFFTTGTHIGLQACLYSLACTPEKELRPIQCVPHIDSPDPGQLAVVHFLCEAPFGGTSFYRHRRTGLAFINRDTMASYFATVKEQMMQAGESALHYTRGSNEWFEQVGQVPAEFNRMVIYHGNRLHAGDLSPGQLSSDPSRGRLTINSFANHSP